MAPKETVGVCDWQAQCSGTRERVAHLYQIAEWTDCSFKFNRETIKAHKLILAMASPVFAAMFFGGVSQKDPVVIVDIQPDAFAALLEYIYTDGVKIDGLEVACDLYYAAKKYMLPRLMKECITYVSSHLSPENVCQTFEFANVHDENSLIHKCVKVFSEKTLEIFKSPGFKKASVMTMMHILMMDNLNIDNELDLFKALAKFGKALRQRDWKNNKETENAESSEANQHSGTSGIVLNDSGTSGLLLNEANQNSGTSRLLLNDAKLLQRLQTNSVMEDSSSTSSTNSGSTEPSTAGSQVNGQPDGKNKKEKKKKKKSKRDKKRKRDKRQKKETKSRYDANDRTGVCIRRMLRRIRFLTLTPKEFAECTFLQALLTKDEICAIGMNIASRNAAMKMPEGFCKCRIPRNMIDKGMPSVTYYSIVNNVRNLKHYESEVFYAKNIPWYITMKPVYKSHDGVMHKAFAVFVFCGYESRHEWSIRADYEFRLMSFKPGGRMPTFKIDYVFTSQKVHCGCTLKWESMIDPCCMENGAIGYEVKIKPDDPIKN